MLRVIYCAFCLNPNNSTVLQIIFGWTYGKDILRPGAGSPGIQNSTETAEWGDMCFKRVETASGRCPAQRADRFTPLGPSGWEIPKLVEGSRKAGMVIWHKHSSETSWFQNVFILIRCLQSCLYRISNSECFFCILEVSTIKVIKLIITKLCTYLRTIFGEWHYLPVALFVLFWIFVYLLFICFCLGICYWNFNNFLSSGIWKKFCWFDIYSFTSIWNIP